ncbi:MAG: sigma-70 family RNA polymerase sigma factor [Gemmataceae bacterium]|nr:sigma-70 family RNA polymerase sigma factor [Gemmataceae bacterium]
MTSAHVNERSQAPGSTSLSLLERVQAQDKDAWNQLVHLYGPLVYQWCRRWQLQAEDAADVLQDVFQAVAARIRSFRRDRPGDSFRGWLWSITRHKIGDHFRKKSQEPQATGGSDALERLCDLPDQPPPEADDDPAGQGMVHRAVDLIRPEFEERTWRAFWRVALEGHATKDVAADLGVTPDAVRMAKSRVLRRLRQVLDEQ